MKGETPAKHTYKFQVFTRGAWGTVTSCDRCGVDHDHEGCMAYLREQDLRWHLSGHFRGEHTRIVCSSTGSILK